MLNGFVGEFLVILGSFHQRAVYAALAAVGVVLAAVYLLWMYQRVFLGEITNDKNKTLPDCSALEKFILATVVVVILAMGIYPQPFLRRMDHSVDAIMSRVLGTGNREQGLGIRGQGLASRKLGALTAGKNPSSQLTTHSSGFPNPYLLIPIPSVGVGR
jgi:formate hydrogenlyase subunit 3/multisubunit Na+/H+ antiporter MnhD subunit